MSSEKPATTKDLKEAIEHLIEHNFSLDPDVLVSLDGEHYKVVTISHWHVEPQLELKIEKIKDIT